MSKRRTPDEQTDQPLVDDLQVAASYALAPSANASLTATVVAGADDDEISLEGDEAGEEQHQEGSNELKAGDSTQEQEDDDDGDDSDLDLEQELKVMTEEDANPTPGAPKTAHEVDPYQASVQTLQCEFALDISSSPLSANVIRKETTRPAGRLQHFLPAERTIVVESSEGGDVLDEGTMLFACLASETLPLGKILEIFGPVKRPLYSIRLPTPSREAGESKEVDDPVADPWSADGKNSKQLIDCGAEIRIVYIMTEARVVDTNSIFASSTRGTDASNLYDEESNNEQFYSDDEEERRSKSKQRGGTRNRACLMRRAPVHRSAVPGFYVPAQSHTTALPPHQAVHQPPQPAPPEDESDTVYF